MAMQNAYTREKFGKFQKRERVKRLGNHVVTRVSRPMGRDPIYGVAKNGLVQKLKSQYNTFVLKLRVENSFKKNP